MFTTQRIEACFAQLTTECPRHAAKQAADPKGERPTVQDVVVLDLLLRQGTPLYEEVRTSYDPGLSQVEAFLEGLPKKGSQYFHTEVTKRGGWGEQNAHIYAHPEQDRPTVSMLGGTLRGKPHTSCYRELSVLSVALRGTLTDPDGNALTDGEKRLLLHSRVWVTVEAQQVPLGLDDDDGGQATDGESVSAPSGEEPSGEVSPYRCRSERVRLVLIRLEETHPGTVATAVALRRAENDREPVAALGWKELKDAARQMGALADLGDLRKEV